MHYLTVLLLLLPGVSIPLNIFLLFVICTNPKVSSGYSGFLIITTIYTICYAFSYVIFNTMIVNDNHGYTMFSLRLLPFGQKVSFLAAVSQNLLFCAGFIFSATHTLYRFCSITGKHAFLFDTKSGVLSVIATFLIYHVTWLCVVVVAQRPTADRLGARGQLIYREFNVNFTDDGFVGSQYWDSNGIRWTDLFGSIALCLMSGTVFLLNAFTTYKIHKFVKASVCSVVTREAQAQLVHILVAQLGVTAMTEIIPCTLVLWGGLVGLSFLCPYCTILSNLFPIFNVMIIVLLVKTFRSRTLEIFGFCAKKTRKERNNQIYSVSVNSLRQE